MAPILATGRLTGPLLFVGNPGVCLYLLDGPEPTLFDAGMTVMAPLLRQDLDRWLGGPAALRRLLLTHSHYDHVGCVPWLRHHAPELEIAAHPLVAEVVARPSAVALIRRLNETVLGGVPPERAPEYEPFAPFPVDRPLRDGDRFETGGTVVEVIATPGHTRDALTFHLPELQAIVPGESAGVPGFSGEILPEFLQSYRDYRESLERLATLELTWILLPHNGVLHGEEARTYLARSIAATERFRDEILAVLDASHGDRERAADLLFERLYRGDHGQPPDAFRINLEAMIRAVAVEFG